MMFAYLKDIKVKVNFIMGYLYAKYLGENGACLSNMNKDMIYKNTTDNEFCTQVYMYTVINVHWYTHKMSGTIFRACSFERYKQMTQNQDDIHEYVTIQ